MSDERTDVGNTQGDPDEAPYAPPAPGGDPDSRKRDLKARLATATTSGDDKTADRLRKELDVVNEEIAQRGRADAGEKRKATAEAEGRDESTPPQGRTAAPAKATTAASKPKTQNMSERK